MRALLVLLLGLTAALTGCESLSKPDGLLARSSEVLQNQRQRLAELASSLRSDPQEQARHTEVQALFDQQYIDPLTEYLRLHSEDIDYAPYLDLVRAERNERCSAVANRYAGQTASPASLQRLKRGYNLSCPAVVDAFAQRVASQQPTTSKLPAAAQSNSNQPTRAESTSLSGESKDCYLLFSIKNFQQAAAPCSAAAANDDAKAQHRLAVIAQANNDQPQVLQWATRSAELGDPNGQLMRANLLSRKGDDEQAFRWLQASADQGQREATYLLAQAYREGTGTATNLSQAQVYLERAANAGDVQAMLQLASQNKGSPSARQWLKQAANKNTSEAQYQLGLDYLEGSSGDIDLQEAYVWLSLALVNGDTRGRRKLEQLSSQLSAEELTQAQNRIHSGLNGF